MRQAIDWINVPPIVIVTGAASANAQLVAAPPAGVTFDTAYRGFYWYMIVSGTPCYINWGTTSGVTATAANVLHPVGRDDVPKSYPLLPGSLAGSGPGKGYWVSALALSGGAGQLCFVFGSTVGN